MQGKYATCSKSEADKVLWGCRRENALIQTLETGSGKLHFTQQRRKVRRKEEEACSNQWNSHQSHCVVWKFVVNFENSRSLVWLVQSKMRGDGRHSIYRDGIHVLASPLRFSLQCKSKILSVHTCWWTRYLQNFT